MTRTQVRNDLTVSILDNPTIIENFRLSTFINNLYDSHYLIDDLFNMKYLYFTSDYTKFEISTVESYRNFLTNKVARQRNKDEGVLFFVDISETDRVFVSGSLDRDLCGIRKKRSKLLKSLN